MSVVHEIGGYWGNHVRWHDFDERRIWGHKTPLPVAGDFVHSEMESGQVARFEIVKVEPKYNPPDMFFADVSDVGWVNDDGTIDDLRPKSFWQKLLRLLKGGSGDD